MYKYFILNQNGNCQAQCKTLEIAQKVLLNIVKVDISLYNKTINYRIVERGADNERS